MRNGWTWGALVLAPTMGLGCQSQTTDPVPAAQLASPASPAPIEDSRSSHVTPPPTSPPAAPAAAVSKTVIVREMTTQTPLFSADGAHVAVRVGDGSPPHQLSVDGHLVSTDEQVSRVVLAPDGTWVSYLASRDGAHALVHQGARIPLAGGGDLEVSDDGKHWAAAIYDSTAKDQVLLGGKAVFVGHTPTALTMAPNGRLAFLALVHPHKADVRVHLVGAKPGPVIEGARGLHFTPSGDVRYVAQHGSGESLDTMKKRGKRYASIQDPIDTLADGRAFFTAHRLSAGGQDGAVVVVEDREHGPYAHVLERAHRGAHTAWMAETSTVQPQTKAKASTLQVVLDGKTVATRDLGVPNPLADRGPAAVGLAIHPSSPELAFGLARPDGFELTLVVAGQPAAPTGLIGQPLAYDATGDRLALLVPTDHHQKQRVRITARPFATTVDGPPLDHVYVETLRYDPHTGAVSYFGLEGRDLVRIEHHR